MRDFTIPSFVFAALLAGGILFAGPGCATTGSGTAVEADDQEEIEIGYGTQRKGDVAASVSTVEADEKREKHAVSRLSDLLKGDVAGVTVTEGPGGGIMVRIRGGRLFTGVVIHCMWSMELRSVPIRGEACPP